MGIDVSLINERHEPIQEIFDPRQVVTRLAIGSWNRMGGSVCLRFVDPCGDAVFNQAQLPELLSELERSMTEQFDAETREHLKKIIRLVQQARGRAHIYVKFIGD